MRSWSQPNRQQSLRKAHDEQIPVWVAFDEGITGIKMSHCLGHEQHPVFDCAGPFEAEWAAARGEHSAPEDEHWQWPRLGGSVIALRGTLER
ncbi:hypothetical protein ACX1DX_12140 [Tessaracoccus sp. Y36]